MLTGSASKGSKNKYYHYYHCTSACGERYKAAKLNDEIVSEITLHVRPLSQLQLANQVILSVFKSKTHLQQNEARQLKVQIEESNRKLSKARDLLLEGDIEAQDYRSIKKETEEKINRMEAKLTACLSNTVSLELLWNKAFSNISKLASLYKEGTTIRKRRIINSIFPKKLTFDGLRYRTDRINEGINLINLISNKLKAKKIGTNADLSDLSQLVILMVQNSNLFMTDLQKLTSQTGERPAPIKKF